MQVAEINISSVIADLLYEHNCVIIPGFGGLVGNRAPAQLDENKNTFYPPYKKLVFNSHLLMNDGLLSAALSKKENISFDESTKMLDAVVKNWQSALKGGKEINVHQVGKFKKAKDKSIAFHQDFSVNYLPEAFGMQAIHVAATQRNTIKEKISRQIIDSTIPSAKSNKAILKIAAAIAVPIAASALFLAINLPGKNSAELNWNPFLWNFGTSEVIKPLIKPDVTITIVRPEDFFSREELLKIYADKLNAPNQELSTSVVKDDLPKQNTSYTASSQFHVIAGCFADENNATTFTEELKAAGFDAHIVGKTPGGLTRVAYGTYSNKLDALKGLANARLKHSASAWMSEE
ncbi:MAG: SPOR domain-containing protein [Bacteroidetes bacterium]|nr:SPOR domain-containing protein [Bacteroidota bacterium]